DRAGRRRYAPGAYGGNPTASLTAAYSGWTPPSALRIVSAGSTHVRSRMCGGRSRFRISANNVTSGGSASRNTTGRLRTIASSALGGIFHTLPIGFRKYAGEQTTHREMRRRNPRVIGDVASHLEPARDL